MATSGGGEETVVGRGAELAVFDGLLAELSNGVGRSVLVEGEPGIGKTALVEAVLGRAREAGFTVFRGTCDELRQRLPLSVFVEAFGMGEGPGQSRAEAALAFAGSSAAPRLSRGWSVPWVEGDPVAVAVEQVLALVDRKCAAAPLALAVDDLQWADEASLLAWQRLCRSTSQLPLLLLGTCRPVPYRAELDRLRRGVRRDGGLFIALDGLGPGAVSELATLLAGGVPGARLAGWLELAGGNPLYLREMLDALARARAVTVSGEIAELEVARDVAPEGRRPGADHTLLSLAGAIADRLDFLTEETRKVLRTAALLGSEFTVTDLSGTLERSAGSLSEQVQEALAAGVLESVGPRLRFRHGLLRQVLYEAIPGPMRMVLHRDAARALMTNGSPVERVAELVLSALDTADGWEVEWVEAHAARLARRAPAIAAELVEHALSYTAEGDPRHASLQDQAATVAFVLARYDRAESVARRILESTRDPERRGQAQWILGYCLMRTLRTEQAVALATRGSEDPAVGGAWRARLASLRAMAVLTAGRYAEAEQAAEHALAEGERAEDPMTVGYALHVLSSARIVAYDMGGCVDLTGRALAVVGTDPQLGELRLMLYAKQVSALANLDRFAEAGDALRAARALGEGTGTPRMASYVVVAGELAYQQGRWDDTLTELDALSGDPDRRAYRPYHPVLVHGIAALIAGHRDDRRTAECHLNALPDDLAAVPFKRLNSSYALLAAAVAAEQAGDPRQALAALEAILEPAYEGLEHRSAMLPMLVRLALSVESPATARAAAQAAAAEAREARLPRMTAAADWCRGLLLSDPNPVSAAVDCYRSAGRPLEIGNALEDCAHLAAAKGDLGAARDGLAEALAVYDLLGAAWDSRRALARLRPFGIRPRGGAARRARTGWAALTDTEVRIAELVGQGKANSDIAAGLQLSRRTVEAHVSHILAKLQARSRREVAELARRRDADSG